MKKSQLTIINLSLIVLLFLTVASSVILEYTGGRYLPQLRSSALVIVHIAVTLALMLLSYLHIRVHFGAIRQWRERFRKSKKQSRWLFLVAFITFLSGLIATVTYFLKGHTPFGGIHGKIGYIALLIMILHLIHRRKWLRNIF